METALQLSALQRSADGGWASPVEIALQLPADGSWTPRVAIALQLSADANKPRCWTAAGRVVGERTKGLFIG